MRFAVAGYLEHMIVLIILLRRPGRDDGAPDNIMTVHTCGLGDLCAMCHPHGSKLTSKLGRSPSPHPVLILFLEGQIENVRSLRTTDMAMLSRGKGGRR